MSRIWHLALANVVAASLVMQIALLLIGGQDVNSGESGAQLDLGTRFVRLFSYFTIQSNLIVLVVATSLALDPLRDGRLWRVLRLDALLGIGITGLIFATLLSGLVQHHGMSAWANAGFHYISPVVTLLGWLFFGPHGRIGWREVRLAFVWPVAWIVYTFVRGAWTGWYPYPFLDVTKHSMEQVAVNVAVILLVAIVFAALLKLIDARLARR